MWWRSRNCTRRSRGTRADAGHRSLGQGPKPDHGVGPDLRGQDPELSARTCSQSAWKAPLTRSTTSKTSFAPTGWKMSSEPVESPYPKWRSGHQSQRSELRAGSYALRGPYCVHGRRKRCATEAQRPGIFAKHFSVERPLTWQQTSITKPTQTRPLSKIGRWRFWATAPRATPTR